MIGFLAQSIVLINLSLDILFVLNELFKLLLVPLPLVVVTELLVFEDDHVDLSIFFKLGLFAILSLCNLLSPLLVQIGSFDFVL